jgi:hypothetical protein
MLDHAEQRELTGISNKPFRRIDGAIPAEVDMEID